MDRTGIGRSGEVKPSVIVGGGCTRIFTDGQLHSYCLYEDEEDGIRIAHALLAEREFLDAPKEDGTIPVLKTDMLGHVKLAVIWGYGLHLAFAGVGFLLGFLACGLIAFVF